MRSEPNALRWDGKPGHYEVYYLTLTDAATGVGFWIRYTMRAPLERVGEPASCALWFLAMDPRTGRSPTFGRKATFPIDAFGASTGPFTLTVGGATLTDRGMKGAFADLAWDLRWMPAPRAYEHVHAAETGEPVRDAFVDGVSVFVRRLGRNVGPSTPVVARIDGRDFRSITPLRVLANDSAFSVAGWRFEAVDGRRKLVCEIEADRARVAGVTYQDPDGELAYCYNGETASVRMHVYERTRQLGTWSHRATLIAPGCVRYEYAQRTPVPERELLTT